MTDIVILCVEDEREVLDALVRDLEPFAGTFRIEAAETVEEARPLVQDLLKRGQRLGLVLADHILPGTTGVEFLVELNQDRATRAARKVLVTAQAGHQDTITAVNEANLDHYIAKPWSPEELHEVVQRQLTDYVLGTGEEPLPYLKALDAARLLEHRKQRRAD